MNRRLEIRWPEPELMDLPEEALAYAAADFSTVNQAFVVRLLELAGRMDAAIAVDLGTGPADIPLRLWHARPLWKIIGVDAAQAMLDIAKPIVGQHNAGEHIQLLLADAKATALPAASFDIVFSNSILHHVSDAIAFWLEIKRLSRSGGLVFLRDLARPVDEASARDILEKHTDGESELLKQEFYRSLLAAYTPGEVRNQLQQVGLTSLSVEMSSDRHLDVFGRMA